MIKPTVFEILNKKKNNVLTKEENFEIISDMLFMIAMENSPKEVSLQYIADGIDPDYILVLEKVAENVWKKYGGIILLYLL